MNSSHQPEIMSTIGSFLGILTIAEFGIKWKYKNRFSAVNSIKVSYKPRPWVTLYSKGEVPAFMLPQHVVFGGGLLEGDQTLPLKSDQGWPAD